jgi:hypothetical protein
LRFHVLQNSTHVLGLGSVADSRLNAVCDGLLFEDVVENRGESSATCLLLKGEDSRTGVLVLEKKLILEFLRRLILVKADKAGNLRGGELGDNHFGLVWSVWSR